MEINLFCSSTKKPEDIPFLEKGIDWIITRSIWDALRYLLSYKIHHLVLPYEFPPDMAGDIYLGEAVIDHLVRHNNYPTGTIYVIEGSKKERLELIEYIRNIDTAREKSKTVERGDTVEHALVCK